MTSSHALLTCILAVKSSTGAQIPQGFQIFMWSDLEHLNREAAANAPEQFHQSMYSVMVEVSENGATSSNRDWENEMEEPLEFTVGNPRVEHITGVIHLFKNASGEGKQEVGI